MGGLGGLPKYVFTLPPLNKIYIVDFNNILSVIPQVGSGERIWCTETLSLSLSRKVVSDRPSIQKSLFSKEDCKIQQQNSKIQSKWKIVIHI